jgi:uptake hydrogenase large subunit
MADFGGGLNILLSASPGGVRAQIRSTRPVGASAVFAGRTAAETAERLPALYSVCATAQAAACAAALEAAAGIDPDPAISALRRRLVDAETVKEHLWRLLLDWPRFLGEPPDAPAMAMVMRAFASLRRALTAGADPFRPGAAGAPEPDADAARDALAVLARVTGERVLGMPPGDWLVTVRSASAFDCRVADADAVAPRLIRLVRGQGWEALGACDVPPLPPLAPPDLEPFLAGPGAESFIAVPEWDGGPRETSPFTRVRTLPLVAELSGRFGSGLLPRLAARLTELAALQATLAGESAAPAPGPVAAATAPGAGIALVAAARGLLAHRVQVEGGMVRDYRILAPTEWNFHPDGAAVRALSALPPADPETLRRQAALLITAVDPCVEYHVTLV